MKRYRLFLILLILTVTPPLAYSQEDTQKHGLPIIVKWTPTSMIGFYPSLQFAGEFYYNYNRSVQLEYGYIAPFLKNGYKNSNGHKIRLEHRFYLKKEETIYLAPEIAFTLVDFERKERFGSILDSTGVLYEDATSFDVKMKRTIGMINFKVGYQYIFFKSKIALDVYLGVGARITNQKLLTYPDEKWQYIAPIDNLFEGPITEGSRWMPNGIAGIKLGYRFN